MTAKEIAARLDSLEAVANVGRGGRPESQRGVFADGWDKGFDDCMDMVRDALKVERPAAAAMGEREAHDG